MNSNWEVLQQLLTIPGEGLYTVSTGAQLKNELHQALFKSTDLQIIRQQWLQILESSKQQALFLLGIPSDNGGGIHRGANWGPIYLRLEMHKNQLLNHFIDLGDVRVIPHLLHDKYLNEQTIRDCQIALYGCAKDLPVSPLSIAQKAAEIMYNSNPDARLFSLGGDHSISYPMVKSWLNKSKIQQKRTAIIHFDAHTDLLDKRLGIDLCFGTWAYHILDDLKKRSDLIQVGIRASGKDKKYWEENLGIQQYWAQEVRQLGAQAIAEKIINYIKREKIEEVYVSFDIDALDSQYAGATGTPEENGIYPHDAALILQALKNKVKVTGADLVEVAPKVMGCSSYQSALEPGSTLRWSMATIGQIADLMHS